MGALFRRTAQAASRLVGSAPAFTLAAALVVLWAATGPLFRFSDTWQLVVNTGTTIVTFLIIFLIQNTQNRDALSIQLKLDELLRTLDPTRKDFLDLEELSDEELDRLHRQFEMLGRRRTQSGSQKANGG